jgi:hypothetical protein
MAFSDFVKNFEEIYLCRFFNEDYVEMTYNSEWSVAKGTAGGCGNTDKVA